MIADLVGYGRRYANGRAAVIEGEEKLEAGRAEADAGRERLSRVQEEVRTYEAAGNHDLALFECGAVYLPSERNGVVAGLYESLGFVRIADRTDAAVSKTGASRWLLNLAHYTVRRTFIRRKEPSP